MKKRLFRVFSRSTRDRARELEEEIEIHLTLRAEDLEAGGLSPQEARREALARFGDLNAAKRELMTASARRDLRLGWRERVDDVRRDLSVALRQARARPGRTAVSVGIFALGIGVSTVMFSITDNVLFRSLPFPEADRLVSLKSVPKEGIPFSEVSMGNWYDWKTRSQTLEKTALYREREVGVSNGTDIQRVPIANVAGPFFETLGLPVAHGRYFLEAEAQDDAQLVVVSDGFWRRFLGESPDFSERSISVDGVEYRVVGVIPPGREFPAGVDLWIPVRYRPYTGEARNNVNWVSIGRLVRGVTLDQTMADLSSIAAGIRETDPEAVYSHGVGVEPLRKTVVGDMAGPLMMLQGAVLLVLLIACANLMGLEFARTRERHGEVAVRLALGASRPRLAQQLITEQMALALLGGTLGLLLASWGTTFVMGRLGSVIPRAGEVTFDLRVVAAGFVLSLLAGLVTAVGPAWRASRGHPAGALSGARTIRGGRGLPGSTLIAAEIALTVLLLTGGGLLLRSMGKLVQRDLGFDAEDVITLDVNLLTPYYLQDESRVVSYWTNLLATLEQTPGVEAAGAGNWIPTGNNGSTFVDLPEVGRAPEGAGYRVVSDGYFEAMGVPLLQGRFFAPDDTEGSDRVVIVNQAMANAFWPDQDPLGKKVGAGGMESYFYGGDTPWLTVVGVVGNMRHHGFEAEARPEMFTLYRQIPGMARVLTAVVRTQPGALDPVMAEVQHRARDVDPSLAVQAGRLDERVRSLLRKRRLITSILVAFGIMALGLACLGVYGVLSMAVSTRTREMAIRSALGATRAGLVGLVVWSGLQVVALGVLGAAVGGYLVRGVLDTLLVDVGAWDPVTATAVAATIGVSSLAAALIPAIRASRMSPLEALRDG